MGRGWSRSAGRRPEHRLRDGGPVVPCAERRACVHGHPGRRIEAGGGATIWFSDGLGLGRRRRTSRSSADGNFHGPAGKWRPLHGRAARFLTGPFTVADAIRPVRSETRSPAFTASSLGACSAADVGASPIQGPLICCSGCCRPIRGESAVTSTFSYATSAWTRRNPWRRPAADHVLASAARLGAEAWDKYFPIRGRLISQEQLEVEIDGAWQPFPCSLFSSTPGTGGEWRSADLTTLTPTDYQHND